MCHFADGERIKYTPIAGSVTAPEYILQDNGVYEIWVNGEVFRRVTIEGVEIDIYPIDEIRARISKKPNTSINNTSESMFTDGVCLNYPHKTNNIYPYFRVAFRSSSNSRPPINEITTENLSLNISQWFEPYEVANYTPIDRDKICIIRYKGFIIFIGNYTA